MTAPPKYPHIEVQLTGNDGNAYAIMGAVGTALKRGLREDGLDGAEIAKEVEAYQTESMSGDYNNLLRTAMKWVSVA